jgi:hypothetical protein
LNNQNDRRITVKNFEKKKRNCAYSKIWKCFLKNRQNFPSKFQTLIDWSKLYIYAKRWLAEKLIIVVWISGNFMETLQKMRLVHKILEFLAQNAS